MGKRKKIDSMERGGRQKNPSFAAPPVRRKKRQYERWLGVLLVLLVLAGVVFAVLFVRLRDYRLTRQEYAAYRNTEAPVTEAPIATQAPSYTPEPQAAPEATAAASPASPPTPAPYVSDRVAKLKKENKDAVAWLDVPGTGVQYPVAQGADNKYYETHTFKKKRRAGGSIFLDAWNLPDGSDFNTVIYGHNMKDGSMFAELREYRHDAFLREHKYIDVEYFNSQAQYKIFAAYVCDEEVDFRGQHCVTEAEKKTFLRGIESRTEIRTNAEAKASDRLLTLVTCTGGERDRYWIVHAVLVQEKMTAE